MIAEYTDIKNLVKTDFDYLEKEIANLLSDKNPLNEQLSTFLMTGAKRLRPLLGLLFSRCVCDEINQKQYNVLTAVELIHNATLIHDDVIDNAKIRRDKETINTKFDNNLAVVAGDFLLSIAMEKVIDTESSEVLKLCTSALKTTCLGEINQNFSKYKILSIEDYVEKSREKTALLFEIGVLGSLMLSNKNLDDIKQTAISFSQNFGTAFQIRDDLLNILNNGNDFSSGIYTAPVIFAYEENKNILEEQDILSAIKKTKGLEKTKNLMDNYFNKAVSDIQIFEDSAYKRGLLELIEFLRKN